MTGTVRVNAVAASHTHTHTRTHGSNYLYFNKKLSEACGKVDRALDSRSEGLGFDSHYWPCVEVVGKLHIPYCLGPPSRNGYLVDRSKVGSIVAGYCAPTDRKVKV